MARYISRVVVLPLVVLFFGCASSRAPYPPVQTTSADAPGISSPARPFPPDRPAGDVRLATMGLMRLTAGPERAVHVRMVVANRSDQPWTIREAEQRIELMNNEQLFATTPDRAALPVLEVPPRTTSTVDLWFPLPPRLRNATEMEPYAVVWTIRVGSLTFTQRSAFEGFRIPERDETVPAAADPFNNPTGGGRIPSAGVP